MQIHAWEREELHREEEGGSRCWAFLLGLRSQQGGLREGTDHLLGEASNGLHPRQAAVLLTLSLGS